MVCLSAVALCLVAVFLRPGASVVLYTKPAGILMNASLILKRRWKQCHGMLRLSRVCHARSRSALRGATCESHKAPIYARGRCSQAVYVYILFYLFGSYFINDRAVYMYTTSMAAALQMHQMDCISCGFSATALIAGLAGLQYLTLIAERWWGPTPTTINQLRGKQSDKAAAKGHLKKGFVTFSTTAERR